jgi:cytochrome P450
MRRLDMKEYRPDFLTPVLRTLNTPQGLTLEQLQLVSEVLVIAGSETTATLLTGLTYHLLTTPTILSKLCTEIRSTFSSDSEINMTSVNKLKYELAVLEEGLRMFPPVPFTPRRMVEGKGKKIAGQWVPPGTMVGVQQWSAYLSKRNFVDADRFCPERWLNNGVTKYKDDKKGVVNAFSMGPRSCLGMTLAYAEMKVILARVFYNYDMELCEESQGWKDGLRMYGLWDKKPLMVTLKKVDRN